MAAQALTVRSGSVVGVQARRSDEPLRPSTDIGTNRRRSLKLHSKLLGLPQRSLIAETFVSSPGAAARLLHRFLKFHGRHCP